MMTNRIWSVAAAATFGLALAGLLPGAAPAAGAGAATVLPGGTAPAETWTDTLHVAAPRVTLDEIIADIGRRQRADRDSMQSVAFTVVVASVRTQSGGWPAGTWELQETALRYEQERGRPDRVAQLWERKQEFVDGVPQPAKEKSAVQPRWQPRPMEMVEDLPFAEGGAPLYRYELVESRLVGSSLVHVVSFSPRDRFAALPSGTIWVDIGDWAIRRVEARFDTAVPFPWVIRAIPAYRLRQAPCGGVWFPVFETARVEMRDLPLVDSGGTWEMKVELRDIVINGEPCDGLVPVDGDGQEDEGAALFWAGIDDLWQAALAAPLLAPSSLSPARLDSLSLAGARAIAAMPERPPYRMRLRPVAPSFNRAQGFVPRVGAVFGRAGGGARLEAAAGPGLDDRRVEWSLAGALPAGRGFSLRAGAARATPAFAGDGRTGQRSFAALLWGGDPNHYFDRTALAATLRWEQGRAASGRAWLEAGYGRSRELPLAVHQRWNVAGRAPSPDGTLAADAVDVETAHVAVGLHLGALRLEGGAALHALVPRTPAFAGDDLCLESWRWSARWQRPDALGNRWTLRAGGAGVDRVAPAQHRIWLGDWRPDFGGDRAYATPQAAGSLSGWPAGSLLGDRGAWASLEVDLNVDPWRAVRAPWLRDLQLRPLLFAEWAEAQGRAGEAWPGTGGAGERGPGAPPTGSRADVGLGFSRRLDLPLVGVGSRLELRAARAVGEASGGRDWRFVVGIGR